MKRSGFKKKIYTPEEFRELMSKKHAHISFGRKPIRRSALKVVGDNPTEVLKTEIQAILRELVTLRDGGCWLRFYPQAGKCGGYTNDGTLILQAEHLHTRANAASFSDSRLVVCICKRHHIYWKPQHSAEYNGLAELFIGPDRTTLWKRVREDYKSHKVDLKIELLGLKQELLELKKKMPLGGPRKAQEYTSII
jgi:hypothetical protein